MKPGVRTRGAFDVASIAMRRVSFVMLASVLAVVPACKKKSAAATTEDSWTVITRGTDASGELSKEALLSAFATLIAPLPEVNPLPRDASLPACATFVADDARRRMGTFSPAQQAAVKAALLPKRALPLKNAVVFQTPDDALSRAFQAAEARARVFFGGALRERVLVTTRSPVGSPPSAVPQPVGVPLTTATHTRWCLRPGATETDPFDPAQHDFATVTQPLTGCSHIVTVQLPFSGDEIEWVLVHELVHAYQSERIEGPALDYNAPGRRWLVEGYASWASREMLDNFSEQRWRNRYARGDLSGGFALFPSTYEAAGFFAHLAGRRVDVKARGLALVNMRDNASAFRSLFVGAEDILVDLASGPYRDPNLGVAWTLPFPIHADTRPRGVRVIAPGVAAGAPPVTLRSGPGEQLTARVGIADDVDVVEVTFSGHGRARFGSREIVWKRPTTHAFCRRVQPGCVCPDNSCVTLETIGRDDLLMALSGTEAASSVAARGYRHAEWLTQPQARYTCGHGRYRVDPESAKAAAGARVGATGQRVTAVTGTMRLTLNRDGSCRQDVQQFGFEMATGSGAGAVVARAVLDGSQVGRCTVTPGAFVYSGPPPAFTTRAEANVGGRWMGVPAQAITDTAMAGWTSGTTTRYRCQRADMITIGPDGVETLWINEP